MVKLQILERGEGREFTKTFKNRIVFSIRKNCGCFSPVLINFLKLEIGSDVVMSSDGKNWHFAVLPFDSTLKGYRVFLSGNKDCRVLAFVTKSYIKRGIPEGIYELKEPIFQNGIDWYLCEKIGE